MVGLTGQTPLSHGRLSEGEKRPRSRPRRGRLRRTRRGVGEMPKPVPSPGSSRPATRAARSRTLNLTSATMVRAIRHLLLAGLLPGWSKLGVGRWLSPLLGNPMRCEMVSTGSPSVLRRDTEMDRWYGGAASRYHAGIPHHNTDRCLSASSQQGQIRTPVQLLRCGTGKGYSWDNMGSRQDINRRSAWCRRLCPPGIITCVCRGMGPTTPGERCVCLQLTNCVALQHVR